MCPPPRRPHDAPFLCFVFGQNKDVSEHEDEDDWSFDICRQNVYIKCFAISLPVSVCFLSLSPPVANVFACLRRHSWNCAHCWGRVGYCDNQTKEGGGNNAKWGRIDAQVETLALTSVFGFSFACSGHSISTSIYILQARSSYDLQFNNNSRIFRQNFNLNCFLPSLRVN